MTQEIQQPAVAQRRTFLAKMGGVAACATAAVGAASFGSVSALAAKTPAKEAPAEGASFPTKDYDWTKHKWGFGVDATKCIGCLRCVEACKTENDVPLNAHQFRTWVERYVKLEDDPEVHIDSQSDPVNIAASGSEKVFRFADRYKDKKVEKAFFVPKLCNQCSNPSCVQVCPTGATYRTKDGVVLIDPTYCIGCRYCVQACPYGVRYFNEDKGIADKCNWCYHRITKGMNPACVEACPVGARVFGDQNDKQSPVSLFIRNNRVEVLRPDTGNAPNVFYVGIDKEVN